MVKKTYSEAIFSDPELKTPEHDAVMLWLDRNAKAVFREASMGSNDMVVLRKVWERPVTMKSGNYRRVIGFVDMEVVLGFPEISRRRESLSDMDDETRTWFESEGYSDNGAGYLIADVEVFREVNIYVEVKPKITSIGELIRQVRFYQTALPGDSVFAVVSPDDRFADILTEQGFTFIKAEHVNVGPQGSLL